jgi:hypothetical protein
MAMNYELTEEEKTALLEGVDPNSPPMTQSSLFLWL